MGLLNSLDGPRCSVLGLLFEKDFRVRSLRIRLFGLWGLSLLASVAVAVLLVQLYRQSTEAGHRASDHGGSPPAPSWARRWSRRPWPSSAAR